MAQAVVNVASSRKTLQHLHGGTVREILVHNGDRVKAGDPLIQLDDTQTRAMLAQIKSEYLSARANEARLLAERDKHTTLAFPDEIKREANDPAIAELMRVQQELFDTRRKSLAGEIAIHRENLAGLQEQLTGLHNLEKSKASQISLLEEQLKGMRALLQKGYIARVQLFELERSLANLNGARGEDLSNIARLQKNIGELRLKILQIGQDYLKELATKLEETDRQISSLREKLNSAQYEMDRVIINAPVDGFVMGLKTHTLGGVILPGQEIMDIVPEGQAFLLDARIQPQDIDKVHIGLKADVRLTAFNRNTTPVVQGEITMVSADRLKDERTGEPYYSSHIKLTDDSMAKLQGLQIQPGMPADVIIKTGERTFLDYLFKPLSDRVATALKEE